MAERLQEQHETEPNPLDDTGLCLLSLDGGGVRALSTLYILKRLMAKLAHERYGDTAKSHPQIRPCEVFDLIGGTGTGGLIAVMLGRLEMTVDECITSYRDLIRDIFETQDSRFGLSATGNIKAQFSSQTLEAAINRVLMSREGISEQDLFNDSNTRRCRVFVCTTAYETKSIAHLRSYSLPDNSGSDISPTICEAALATSAMTHLFDPVRIGARKFVDGAMGANNPVDEVEDEAAKIWCPDTSELKPLVKCFISIGTGNPGKAPIEDKAWKFLSKTLIKLATETEKTAGNFAARWKGHLKAKRYFRFNVQQGLQDIGLVEYRNEGAIEAATAEYLDDAEQYFRLQDCVRNLKQKKNATHTAFAYLVKDYHIKNTLLSRKYEERQWLVPFERNPRFVAREAHLHQLEKLLLVEGRCPKVALVGLGGVGKTQIAIELIYRIRAKYTDHSIFWIPAGNTESLEQAYHQIGQKLRVAGLDQPQADIKELVKRRLSSGSSGKWLLVFDNADDVDMWTSKSNSIASGCLKDYLPNSHSCSILFTTRSRKTAFELAGHSLVEVSEMDVQAASRLFQQILPNYDISNDDPSMLQLLEKLTYLPLAIIQAAAYMDRNGASFSEYLALLEEKEEDVIQLLSEYFQDEGNYRNDRNPVATTWLVSFEQIQRNDSLAAYYLSFMSCLDSKDIPQTLLPQPESRKDFIDAIGTLSGYSFVIKRADQAIDIHRLVRLATRNWLRMNGKLEEWVTRVFAHVYDVFPSDIHENRRIWRLYLPHAQRLLELIVIRKDNEVGLGLMEKVGLCLLKEGRNSEAGRIFSQLIEIRNKDEKQSDNIPKPSSFTSINKEGQRKEPDQPDGQFSNDKNHLAILRSMHCLAYTYRNRGRLEEAEKLALEVIEARKKGLGEGHADTLDSVTALISTYLRKRQLEEVERLSLEVLEMRKKYGLMNKEAWKNIEILGSVYLMQGRFEEAEKLSSQVVEEKRGTLGDRHLGTLSSKVKLASIYRAQGRYNEAEKLYLEVVEMRKRELGEKHPLTLSVMSNLAALYQDQGRSGEANALSEYVFEASKREIGERHPDTLTCMSNLAIMRKHYGRKGDAIRLMMECSKLRDEVLGPTHPSTIKTTKILKEWQDEELPKTTMGENEGKDEPEKRLQTEEEQANKVVRRQNKTENSVRQIQAPLNPMVANQFKLSGKDRQEQEPKPIVKKKSKTFRRVWDKINGKMKDR